MRRPDYSQTYAWLQQWRNAQRANDVEAMEEMLSIRHLNLWWHLYHRASSEQLRADLFSCLDRIFVKAGLVADGPERPSEAAMRLSEPSPGGTGHQTQA